MGPGGWQAADLPFILKPGVDDEEGLPSSFSTLSSGVLSGGAIAAHRFPMTETGGELSPRAILVMGVCGSGKSTLAHALANALGADFIEADHFHSAANVSKMRSGVPLNDEDRWPWLDALNAEMRRGLASGRDQVLACSALKEQYRRILSSGIVRWNIVFLHGEAHLLEARLLSRTGHYMPGSLLQSQLATLEAPEFAINVDLKVSLELAVSEVLKALD